MGLVATATAGLVIWIVLWSLGIKAIDGFMLVIVLLIGALITRALLPILPGNRES